jgi:hypothetical protein
MSALVCHDQIGGVRVQGFEDEVLADREVVGVGVSVRVTPNKTARRGTRMASSWSRGSPRTPGPGSCMVRQPSRRTGRSPPLAKVPAGVWSSERIEERSDVIGEQLRVLVQEAVIGVRVDSQVGVRE